MKKRIVFITPQINLELSGIANTSYHLIDAFSRSVKLNVLCGSPSVECKFDNVKIYKSKFGIQNLFSKLLLAFSIKNKLERICKENKPDFVLSIVYTYAIGCMKAKKKFGVRYGVMVHGSELMHRYYKIGLISKLQERQRKKVLENADIVFANSQYTKDLLLSMYKIDRCEVIHPPIHFKEKNFESSKINFSLLSLGRIVERKGYQDVIEAMPEILKEFPQMRYIIAGTGEYEDMLKKRVNELHLTKRVIFKGRVSESEKEKLYQECDYFILPSYPDEKSGVEGFGIVYVEANMYGKYVLASKTGGIPDAVIEGVTGEFVKEKDAMGIAKAIIDLYRTPKDHFQDCIEWAKKQDRIPISKQYLAAICRVITK